MSQQGGMGQDRTVRIVLHQHRLRGNSKIPPNANVELHWCAAAAAVVPAASHHALGPAQLPCYAA